MLLSLGFGTQFSTVETVVTVLLDRFPNLRGKNRRWATLPWTWSWLLPSRWCTLGVCLFMFCCGLSMVTNGGIYILQLVDNHSATYSALILGCLEVSVMAWIYGVDKFLEDLRFMLGFYPYPRLFWKWSWKISSPVIVIVSCIALILWDFESLYSSTWNSRTFFPVDPELHDQGLRGEQVRHVPLSRLGEHRWLVHHLLLSCLHSHRRVVQDRPSWGKPVGPHQPTYHRQVPRNDPSQQDIVWVLT